MPRIKLLDVAEIDIQLDELLRIVQILKQHLDKKSKRLINDLLEEIDKIYLKIVAILNPLYAATNDNVKFKELFLKQYADYKARYLSDLSDVEFSCNNIQEYLNNLDAGGWKLRLLARVSKAKKFSLNQEQQRFLADVHIWYGSDKKVYEKLQHIQDQLNQELDGVNEEFKKNGIIKARRRLKLFLNDSESNFNNFKTLRRKLKRISSTLLS